MVVCWIFFLLLKYSLVNCDDYLCNYLVNKSDNRLDICISNECDQFIDPNSIMVTPNHCKTKNVSLAFSSYKTFTLFLNRIPWKLGDLFPSKLNNHIRLLRIYIKQIDFDDQPIDQYELYRLGRNFDLYQLYSQNLPKNNSLYQLIHYDPNNPQWDVINIQFICKSLIRFDENSCSTQILSPSVFAPRRPPLIISLYTTLQLSSSSTWSTKQSNEQNERSIDFIFLILILLIPIIISIFLCIFLIRNRSSKRDLTSRTSSIPSISNHLNGLYSECHGSAKPYQVSRLPSPHTDSLYKETQTNF